MDVIQFVLRFSDIVYAQVPNKLRSTTNAFF